MRRRVQTSYRRAGSSPSKRQKPSQSLTEAFSEGSHLSPLARYLTENEDSGVSREELIEQFRELDCEHREVTLIANSNNRAISRCDACGKVTTVEK